MSDFIPIYIRQKPNKDHEDDYDLVRGSEVNPHYPTKEIFKKYYTNVSFKIRFVLYFYTAINLLIMIYYSTLVCSKKIKKAGIGRKLEFTE